MKIKDYIEKQICPICHWQIEQSEYLKEIFENDQATLWLANLVTHYRHNHITSWNKCWGPRGNYYRRDWFDDYDMEKAKVNERAKRQLVRKGHLILFQNGVNAETFENLENTTQETLDLVGKYYKKFMENKLPNTKEPVAIEKL